eukprot:gene16297-19382_t
MVCPFTKVEESFNLQAMHDILYHRDNIAAYDHLEFPGVIPRTFIGALVVSILSAPFVYISTLVGGMTKLASLYIVRAVLGALGVTSISVFRRAVARKYGADTAFFFVFVCLSQFHLLFYMSRPLPNTFALCIVLVAYAALISDRLTAFIALMTVSIFVFRSEVLVLAAPIVLWRLLDRSLTITRLAIVGTTTAIISVLVSTAIDSFFWQRLCYPEAEVFLFNTLHNKSHEWGVFPLHWYFSSALPRALLLWLPLVPFAVRRVHNIAIPVAAFVALYSLLPHKELRFIFYAIPIFNLAIASTVSKINYGKSKWYQLGLLMVMCIFTANMLASFGLLFISSKNYPGGYAFNQLHSHAGISTANGLFYLPDAEHEPTQSVHIDNLAAISGVSRFGEIAPHWLYSKKEGSITYRDYSFLIAPNNSAAADYGYTVVASTSGYSHIERTSTPPYLSIVEKTLLFVCSAS